jgi:23S rRNA (uracil1939-C5)-methyltransferase
MRDRNLAAEHLADSSEPPALRRDDVVETTVERLALGGLGLSRHGRFVLFLDGGLPGDRVRARVTRRKSRFADAVVVERLADGPQRIAAPCAHYRARECGGCRVQDLAYEAQCAAKEGQVRETLAHLGGFADAPVSPIVPSPDLFGYRNKMEFSFQPDAGGSPVLGLHRRGRFDQVFPLERCWICSPLTNEIVSLTQHFARAHRWAAYEPRVHSGLVRFLVVRHLPTTEQALVDLVAAGEHVPDIEEWARAVAALDARVRSVVLDVNRARAHIAVGEPGRQRVLHGDALIEERLLGLSFEVGAAAFLQTNSRQAEALYAAALEEAALTGEERVVDVYCGAGTITLALARRAREIVGMEVVEAAVRAAERNAVRNGIANARFLLGEARALLREWREPWTPDVAVVDPPRAGLHPRAIHHLARLAPRRIVYVSCHPGTLARDLREFAARGYALERVRPFDLFPHTPHIEIVARLELHRE